MATVDGIVISFESAKSTYEKQIERLIGKIGEIRSDYDRKVLVADLESKKLIISKLENTLEGKNKELEIYDDQRHCHEAELLEFRDTLDISNREHANIQQQIKSQQAKLLELSGNSSLTADTGATQSQSLKLLF
eukprot:152009_1